MRERECLLMVVSLLGLVELARGKSALSGEGERTFGQNSNCRLGDVGGVMMGLLMTLKITKILGCAFSRDSYKCNGCLYIYLVFEEVDFGIQNGWF